MPIGEQSPITRSTGNGSAKTFAFSFCVLALADLTVRVGNVVVTSGFTVAGLGNRSGGTVTFSTAPAAGVEVLLYRKISRSRATDYQYAGDLREDVLDDDFDRLYMLLQEDAEVTGRTVRGPLGDTFAELPAAASRANKLVGFDSAGALVLRSSLEVNDASILTCTQSAAAAAGSASTASSSATTATQAAADAQSYAAGVVDRAGRNRVTNGDMNVSQRGDLAISAVTANTTGAFGGPDRFFVQHSFSVGTLSLTQTQGLITLPSGRKIRTCKQTVTTGTAETFGSARYFAGIATTLENANVADLSGRQATLSFWARASVAGTYSLAVRRGTLNGGSVPLRTYATNVTLAANTNTLVTLTLPALPFDLYSTGENLTIHFGAQNLSTYQVAVGEINTWGSGGNICAPGWTNWLGTTGATLEIGELQLEPGSAATPFERRPIADNLAQCRRYYQKSSSDGVSLPTATLAGAVESITNASGFFNQPIQFNPPMRATPTVVTYSTTSGTAGVYLDISSAQVRTSALSNTSPLSVTVTTGAVATANYAVRFHWVADAEITA